MEDTGECQCLNKSSMIAFRQETRKPFLAIIWKKVSKETFYFGRLSAFQVPVIALCTWTYGVVVAGSRAAPFPRRSLPVLRPCGFHERELRDLRWDLSCSRIPIYKIEEKKKGWENHPELLLKSTWSTRTSSVLGWNKPALGNAHLLLLVIWGTKRDLCIYLTGIWNPETTSGSIIVLMEDVLWITAKQR